MKKHKKSKIDKSWQKKRKNYYFWFLNNKDNFCFDFRNILGDVDFRNILGDNSFYLTNFDLDSFYL